MKGILSKLRKPPNSPAVDLRVLNQLSEALAAEFSVYQTPNLKGISAEAFEAAIQSRIGVVDAAAEGYSDEELGQQRDLSIKFHWGHDHDFGSFQLDGRMKDRHLSLMADFIALFPFTMDDLRGKHVLDVGCWTGGTALMLATLAERVLAIEEVKKYADTASFLAESFGIQDRLTVQAQSVYDCNSEAFADQFDVVHFPGVIYHLSDPLLSLRILFNSLKVGGWILVESAGIETEEPLCRFDGSLIYGRGTQERLNRGGWNWFMPSPSALYRMMKEAGFDEIQSVWYERTGRVYAYGKKLAQVPICRAGLSVPDIR